MELAVGIVKQDREGVQLRTLLAREAAVLSAPAPTVIPLTPIHRPEPTVQGQPSRHAIGLQTRKLWAIDRDESARWRGHGRHRATASTFGSMTTSP